MRYEVIEGVDIIESLEMDPEIYKKIILKLETETNIKFKYYQKNYVIKRIKSRINTRNLSSDGAYYEYLKDHPEEVELFLDNFTINYTYFFRNYGVFQKLVSIIEDARISQQSTIKIWSSPCASGEEPYSLSMLLEQTKANGISIPNYEIVGSDINPNAIENAKRGIYGEHALSETPETFKKKYFKIISKNPPKYRIIKPIRNKVEFINEDITLGHQKPQKYDIILCRNFIIYINTYYRKELFKLLKRFLKEKGLVILGKTENVSDDNALKLIDPINQFYKYSPNNQKDKASVKSHLAPKVRNNRTSKRKITKIRKQLTQTEKKRTNNRRKLPNTSKKVRSRKEKEKKKEKRKEKEKNLNQKKQKRVQKNNDPQTGKQINKQFKELKSQRNSKKKIFSLQEFNKKLKKSKLQSKQDVSREAEKGDKRNGKEVLQNLKAKMDKELSYLHQQREQLNKKISNFQKRQEQFEQKREQFKQKKILFEKQKKQYKRELDWFKKQKEQFKIKKERFEAKRARFIKKKQEFQEKKKKLNKSQRKQERREKEDPSVNETILSLGNYMLINKKDKTDVDVLSLYGLGSSYLLILVDPITKIYCMTHILFPKPKSNKDTSKIDRPHQYASHCVPYLVKKMLVKGASEGNISAYIVGGSQIFNKQYDSIKKTYNILKNELDSYNLKVLNSDIGGKKRRIVKYNLNDDQLRLRHEGEESFKIL